ncbi:MAG: ABC transporter permease [Planctomycetaceae bacterium]|nr:ABC transporter permease [Planctomycetaceae bacterium]
MLFRRLTALVKKESLQVLRDPSCILIAFVLPIILLFIFGYGLSLDAKHVKLAFVAQEQTPEIFSLFNALDATDYIAPSYYEKQTEAEEALVNGRVRGILVLQNDFSQQVRTRYNADIQLITDGVETNTATLLENYIIGVINHWKSQQLADGGTAMSAPVNVKTRILFNPELKSKNTLIPGSIALILAVIGTLLTSLVVAREWERGTMEAMLATPVSPLILIAGKLVPYYFLGTGSAAVCVLLSHYLFHVPFRGSVGALFMIATAFLGASLALGFLISTATKNQYLASLLALMFAFMPNVMLSGAIFEISAMPLPIRILTYLFPARYFVSCLQTVFMTGDIWRLFLPNLAVIIFIAAILFAATLVMTPKRLE